MTIFWFLINQRSYLSQGKKYLIAEKRVRRKKKKAYEGGRHEKCL